MDWPWATFWIAIVVMALAFGGEPDLVDALVAYISDQPLATQKAGE